MFVKHMVTFAMHLLGVGNVVQGNDHVVLQVFHQ